MGISEFTVKVIGDKRRWRAYKARKRQLPANYRAAVEALERYLMYFGPADGDSAASVFEDLIDVFEQAAADETPIREVVGDDAADFADALVRNYSKGGYVTREHERLASAIRAAEADGGRS